MLVNWKLFTILEMLFSLNSCQVLTSCTAAKTSEVLMQLLTGLLQIGEMACDQSTSEIRYQVCSLPKQNAILAVAPRSIFE